MKNKQLELGGPSLSWHHSQPPPDWFPFDSRRSRLPRREDLRKGRRRSLGSNMRRSCMVFVCVCADRALRCYKRVYKRASYDRGSVRFPFGVCAGSVARASRRRVRRYLREMNAFDTCHNYYVGERLLVRKRATERERGNETSDIKPRGLASHADVRNVCVRGRRACVCTANGAARGTVDSTELITDSCKMLFRRTRRINKRASSKRVNRRRS